MEIGVDLGGTNIRAGLVNKGRVLKKETTLCPSRSSEQEVLQCLEELIARIIVPNVKGIGIGVPSVVDAERGIVYNVANIPSWKCVELKNVLEKRFALPAFVNNDSNCFALGVSKYGEGCKYRNLVGLTIGTGIGAGVIIDGKLYCGKNTGAGEVGSLHYLDYDFEHYCSSGFFVRYHSTTGKEAAAKAARGDEKALKIWMEFGHHLGELMKTILFIYDPEVIVIGGGIASALPFYQKAMFDAMSNFPYPETLHGVRIMTSKVEDMTLLGASALV